MGRILALDQNMINMIAAGEVIERPASIVKELMENSIDSGATRVDVLVEDGGRKLISVVDNGCGMDSDDLDRAFLPHTTSKVSNADDLSRIMTLGFRGEALASIGSVAKVRAVSRVQENSAASCIEIDCGDKSEVGPCSGDYGTTIQVRDIFYKLPARRKFLRTANTEMSHVSEIFTRIGLATSGVEMSLSHNGRQSYRLGGNWGVTQRVGELFSKEMGEGLIGIDSAEKGMRIRGYIGRPDISRTNNKFQYVFLNGRFIRDKFISHAIREAYRGHIDQNRYAVVFLFLEMDPEDFDVNVHPTKTEVRFFNSNLVHSQVLGAIREKLLATDHGVDAYMTGPGVSGGVSGDLGGHADRQNREVIDAMNDFFKRQRSGENQKNFSFKGGASRSYGISAAGGRSEIEDRYSHVENESERQNFKAIQIHDSYIVCQTQEGFVIVDQHALHERIMYENLKKRMAEGNLESQKLLLPESFEVKQQDAETIEENREMFERLGIELEEFGPGVMAVQSFPVLVSKAGPAEFVRDLLDFLAENPSLEPGEMVDEILHMAACKAAIKAGKKLSEDEIEQLLSEREVTEGSGRCPHGRPTTIKFSLSELEKQFKRT